MYIDTKKIKYYYKNFIKLPIQYKIITSILISLIIHLSFSLLFYIGLYNYTLAYGINYQAIDNINITLLSLPFYFDVIYSLILMTFITLLFIIFLLIIEFRFQKYNKTNRTFSLLYKKIYKSMKKDNGLIRFSKKHIILLINTTFIFLILSFLIIFLSALSFNIPFLFIYKIFIPFIIALLIVIYINNFEFKHIILIIIFYIIIASINSIRMNGVKEYLSKNHMGGEIPLSLNIKNKFYNGFLILLTNKEIYFLNENRTILTVIDKKNVFKINYISKVSTQEDNNNSIANTPATGSKKSSFSKLHY